VKVPFFRPDLGDSEVTSVVESLRSGWLTSGPFVRRFESEFARYVGARHAVAVNSCTAALHLALEAVGVRRGDLVVVPTLTFAATAEVVRYFDAIPVMVDSEDDTLCIDVDAATRTLDLIRQAEPAAGLRPPYGPVRAIIPVHYGGQMADVTGVRKLADAHGMAVIEDAAHTLPAFTREHAAGAWQSVGTTADITCFSFYANKCITTGEGGMAVTDREDWADRMSVMSLHGLSKDAWARYSEGGSPRYEIIAPGFKYNMTDLAAALGIAQLARADALWKERARLAARYRDALADVGCLELPQELPNRRHSWHLFVVRLHLDRVRLDRDGFAKALSERGVATSLHWIPLHLHRYYRETFGTGPGLFPVAEAEADRLITLPLFAGMTAAEQDHVVSSIREIARVHRV
jgi:perosamine synthetase